MPHDLASLEAWFDQRLDEKLAEREAARTPSLAIIATKGTMDMAYPPFILATTAAALGWDTSIFFTFYGLELLKKDLAIKVSPLGNPAMPMKMPFGPEWLKRLDMPIPNALTSNLPGFERLATAMMEQTVKAKGVPSIRELRDISVESGVRLDGRPVRLSPRRVHPGDRRADWGHQLPGRGETGGCVPVRLKL
jgi:peroxiredoxin family protein